MNLRHRDRAAGGQRWKHVTASKKSLRVLQSKSQITPEKKTFLSPLEVVPSHWKKPALKDCWCLAAQGFYRDYVCLRICDAERSSSTPSVFRSLAEKYVLILQVFLGNTKNAAWNFLINRGNVLVPACCFFPRQRKCDIHIVSLVGNVKDSKCWWWKL